MIQFSKPEIKLTASDMKKIQKSINSGWFCNGEYVQELEKHFREKFNVKYAIACASATSGLIIAFKALGIKNKVVVMPAFTWPSTAYAAECNNNVILWCDIDLKSWDMNLDLVENGGHGNCWDCQVPVDIFGNESYATPEKISIIDAAHGYGLDNLGHRGDIEVVSMSFTKPVIATQGGMIIFNEDKLYENVQELVRLSAKLTEVNAYIALKSIEQFDKNQKIKSEIRQLYRDNIDVPYKEQEVDICSNYSTFSILFNSNKKRDAVAKAFKENNIEVKIYYEPLFKGLKNTDKIFSRIISLPVYEEAIPYVKHICKIINEA